MPTLNPEIESRKRPLAIPLDYEDRMMNLAMRALDDILECDGAGLLVVWKEMAGVTVPLLYVYFANTPATERMPRLHLDDKGVLRPAHAICLASLPSGRLLDDAHVKYAVRKGVEDFLRKHNVTREG
jgi:hypothetical protein